MTGPIAPPTTDAENLASWFARVGAAVIDQLPTVVALVVAVSLFGDTETTDSSASFQLNGAPALIYFAVAVAWLLVNWGLLQGRSGQTIGKKVLGIAVHRAGTHQPIGFGLSVGRQLVHALDAIPCYLGFLWPLWDKQNRTFADMLVATRVRKV